MRELVEAAGGRATVVTTIDLSGLELGIHDAAKLVKCSPEALRLWERQGRIPPARRDEMGRRVYRIEEVERISELRNRRRESAPVV